MKKCSVCKEAGRNEGDHMCIECAKKTARLSSRVAKRARKFERRRWQHRPKNINGRDDATVVLLEAAKNVLSSNHLEIALVSLEDAVHCAEELLR